MIYVIATGALLLGIWFFLNSDNHKRIGYSLLAIFMLLFVMAYLSSVGFFEGFATPSGAKEFAYDHMSIKNNITFIDKQLNPFGTTLWATDEQGINYRVQNWFLFNDLKIGKEYTIKYVSGYFNMLWEIKRVT